MELKDKNYLIVGASSGIGLALATQLLAKGASVWGTSRNGSIENKAVKHIQYDALAPSLDWIANLPEVLDGVAYMPGNIVLKPFHRLSDADFLEAFQINLLGAVGTLRAVLPRLKKANQASVILFSTVAVQTGLGFHASIAAAKGAVEGLTRALAAEWAPKIRVNAIAPSLTQTPLAQNLLSSPEKIEASNKRHPLGRVGTPFDVANIALTLLSPENSWVTGQIWTIDGGLGALRL